MVVLLWCPWCYLRFLYFDAINTLQYLSCFFLLSWPRCSIDSCVHNSSTNFFALHHQLCTMQWVFGITTLTLFVIGLYFVLLHHPQTQEIFLPACDLFWLLCHALMVVSLSHDFFFIIFLYLWQEMVLLLQFKSQFQYHRYIAGFGVVHSSS